MTTITAAHPASAQRVRAVATPFERALLRAASALDVYVAARLERRTGAAALHASAVRSATATFRREAEARGALGLLPR